MREMRTKMEEEEKIIWGDVGFGTRRTILTDSFVF
jgi:hypothetical protein